MLIILGIGTFSITNIQSKQQPKQNVVFGEGILRDLETQEIIIPSDGEVTTVSEEWIYYQQDNALWKIKVDGSIQTKVLDLETRLEWEYIEGTKGKSGYIYYLYEGNVLKINLEDEKIEKISNKIFDRIQYLTDDVLNKKYLAFSNQDSAELMLINEEGIEVLLELRSGVTKIIINGDNLIYSTIGAIYQYDMVDSQEREIVSYQNYISQDNYGDMFLIGIEDNFIYYSMEEIEEFSMDIYKINIKTLEKMRFYQVYSGLQE